MSVMSKLTAQGISQNRPFKPKMYQGIRRGQAKSYYDQDKYQNRYRIHSGDRRMSHTGRAQYGKNLEEGGSMIKIIVVILGKAITEECKIIEIKILEVDIEGNFRNDNFGKGRNRSRER